MSNMISLEEFKKKKREEHRAQKTTDQKITDALTKFGSHSINKNTKKPEKKDEGWDDGI